MGVVCVTVVVIFVLRRRKRRKIVIHSPAIAMSNLVYGGITLKLQHTHNMHSAVYSFLCFYAVTDDSIAKEKYNSGVQNPIFTADDTYDVPTWGQGVYEAIQGESPYEMV